MNRLSYNLWGRVVHSSIGRGRSGRPTPHPAGRTLPAFDLAASVQSPWPICSGGRPGGCGSSPAAEEGSASPGSVGDRESRQHSRMTSPGVALSIRCLDRQFAAGQANDTAAAPRRHRRSQPSSASRTPGIASARVERSHRFFPAARSLVPVAPRAQVDRRKLSACVSPLDAQRVRH